MPIEIASHRPWHEVPAQRIADGIERQMVVGDKLMICRLTLQPNVDTPVHSHPHEQMTIVERGRVRFTVGDEAYSMNPATPPCISKNPNNPTTANGAIKYAVPGVVTWGRVRPTVTRPKHWYATQKDR